MVSLTARSVPVSTALVGAGLLGIATGLRSQMGLAGLVVGGGRDLPGVLRSRRARLAVSVAAVGELAVDKYPRAPARTEPAGLAARIALGGLAGGLATRRRGVGVAPGVAVAAMAAVASAYGGIALRAWLSSRCNRTAVAVGEDALSVGLAALAVRLVGPGAH